MQLSIQLVEDECGCIWRIAKNNSPSVPTKDWIYKLEGTEDQVTTVSVGPGSSWYLYGSVCKPHDCGDNNFAFLALVIISRFRELTPVQQSQLFDYETSALGSFFRKIQIGFALQLFGQRVYDDLDAIRRIRNAFAHHLEVRTFDHDEVKVHCDRLHFPRYQAWSTTKPEITDRRERYLSIAAHLAERFGLEGRLNAKRPADPRFYSYDMLWPFP